MKIYAKVLLGCALLAVVAVLAMEGDAKKARVDDTEQVIIQTNEGQEFKVAKNLVAQCETLKILMEDAGTEHPLPLPNVSAETWVHVQELLPLVEHIATNGSKAAESKSAIISILSTNISSTFLDLMNAFNYLDIPVLLELALYVAKNSDIKKFTPEQIGSLPRELSDPILFSHMHQRLGALSLSTPYRTFKDSTYPNALVVTPDGKYLVRAGINGMLTYFDLETMRKIREFKVFDDMDILISPNSKKLIVFDNELDKVKIIDFLTGQVLFERKGHKVTLLADGSKFGIYDRNDDFMLYIYDLTTLILLNKINLYEIEETPNSAVSCLSGIPKTQSVCISFMDASIAIYNIITGEFESKFDELQVDVEDNITRSLVTPDGQYVVLYSHEATKVFIIELASKEIVGEITVRDVPDLYVSPDSQRLLINSFGEYLGIYDLGNGALLGQLSKRGTTSLVVLPDSKHVITGDNLIDFSQNTADNTILFWDITLLSGMPYITSTQAEQIWRYLQSHKNGDWDAIYQILEQVPPAITGTITYPPLMPVIDFPTTHFSSQEPAHKKQKPDTE